MDRYAKLRVTLGTTNILQQSSLLSYHKYREIHLQYRGTENRGLQIESSAESNIFLKKSKVGKMDNVQ